MKIVLFANTDWYLYNFRWSLATMLRDAGHEVVLLSPPGKYGEKMREFGFRWLPVPMHRRSLNPIRELAVIHWLRRTLVEERADLVHGFTIKCAVYGSLAARWAGVPARVNTVAGMGYIFTSSDLTARLLRPLVSALMRSALDGERARLILQNVDDIALFGHARIVHSDRVRLIPGSGVNCLKFTPAPSRIANAFPKFRILLPARMLWDKGVNEFVRAARQLNAEGRAIEFILAGDTDPGNPAAVPRSTLHAWAAEGVVQWLGHVDEMADLLRTVDAVVLPSYREGLPKGLIEAAACGLPLITTDAPGCRAVVTNDVDGLIVPIRDAGALVRAVARLHDDRELRGRLGAAARLKALREFDEQIVNSKTVAVYRELIVGDASLAWSLGTPSQ